MGFFFIFAVFLFSIALFIYFRKNRSVAIFILFFGLCLFLTLNKHRNTGYFNYHSEIWGDKAGYYSYLPALFIYDFKADKLPENIVEKTGYGFRIDSVNNKITTKYTCGIAIMQSPFYIVTHLALEAFNKENDGFHPLNFKMIDFSAIVYLVIGLFLLFRFLQPHYSNKTIFISLFALFFSTNLYYYGIDETGMSHIYSFFLFSAFLYLSQKIIQRNTKLYVEILFGITCGLIILIRPINIIFFSSFFFIDTFSKEEFIERFKLLWDRKRLILVGLMSVLLVMLPQFIYWKYLSGSFIYYSYEGEGFTNILNPQIFKVWFSTLNGQILYVPATILFLTGLFPLFKKNKILSTYISFVFLIITFLFASWWSWNFGCGFGIRPYVDYMPLFAIPLATIVDKVIQKKTYSVLFVIMVLILIIYNLKLIYSYDGCWYGGAWDWHKFFNWILS